jgi:hypothetical protein
MCSIVELMKRDSGDQIDFYEGAITIPRFMNLAA